MKYPKLELPEKVMMHKAFSKPIVLHFDAQCEGDDEVLRAYSKHLLKAATIRLADNFIINQAVPVENHDGYFILCKDNLDISMMKGFVAAIMDELQLCAEGKITFVFGYAKSLLMVDGCNIGIFASNQVGKDYLISDEYLQSTKETYPKTRVYVGHFLPTFDEFKKEYTNFTN